jgi:murein DD-endopeptidase MepM/ murein hydrolase activator NlpD
MTRLHVFSFPRLALGLATMTGALLLGQALWMPTLALSPVPVTEKLKPIYDVSPTVKQGEVVKISVVNPSPDALPAKATLAGRTITLFQQADDRYLGLLPVKVNESIGAKTLKILDSQGTPIHQTAITVTNAKYSRQNVTVSKSMGGLQPEPGELDAVAKLKTTVSPTRWWFEPLSPPTPDCMNSPFGNLRYHNGVFTDEYHKGLDQRSPAGRPVQAIAGGKVQIARMYRLHGGTVGLDHGQGVTSIYIHMAKILVTPGQQVAKGQSVGLVGSTGFATGPHLHWGLFVNGLPINPVQLVHGIPRC